MSTEPEIPRNVVILGDSREELKKLPDNSIDSICTDPPAGISFMSKKWDDPDDYYDDEDESESGVEKGDRAKFVAFLTEIMRECLRVLKPGGHMLCWSIPRTSHWTATAIEDAGFEIRDAIHHLFGVGFPKSLNVGKVLDKMGGVSTEEQSRSLRAQREAAGLTREQVAEAIGCTPASIRDWEEGRARKAGGRIEGILPSPEYRAKLTQLFGYTSDERTITGTSDDRRGDGTVIGLGLSGTLRAGGNTEPSKRWDGWGTQLKPAVETWWLARKPIEAQNVAAQVLTTGTGAINIDGTRIGTNPGYSYNADRNGTTFHGEQGDRIPQSAEKRGAARIESTKGRWPSNLVLSHSEGCGEGQAGYECVPGCAVAKLDEQSGVTTSGAMKRDVEGYPGESATPFLRGVSGPSNQHGGTGGASRFFATFEPDYDAPFIYTGKASKKDKNLGLEDMPERAQHKIGEQKISTQSNRRCRTCGLVKFGQPHCKCAEPEWEETEGSKSGNFHPTVKSQSLMTYLVRLVTPKGGTVLDPFAGSGSTLVAAVTEGMNFIGIEREADYHQIAQKRVDAVLMREEETRAQTALFDSTFALEQE